MVISFIAPTKIIFGINSIHELPNEIKKYGSKVLILTGRKALKETGLLADILSLLDKNNLRYEVYSHIIPEPDAQQVDEALSFLKRFNPEVVVGIGGGSVIDVAKAISGLANEINFSSCSEYFEVEGTRKIQTNGIPFISVPTVFGTGSEVTMNAVIRSIKTKIKRSIRSEKLLPKCVISDPNLSISVPNEVLKSSVVDCFCHLVEGVISKKSNRLCLPFILDGLRLLKRSIFQVLQAHDMDSRIDIAQASLYSGLSILNSGLTLAHGIGGVIGGIFNISHGIACGVALPYVLKRYIDEIESEKRKMLDEIFDDVIEFTFRINNTFNLKKNIKFALEKDDVIAISNEVLSASSTKNNPVPVDVKTVEGIVEAIFS